MHEDPAQELGELGPAFNRWLNWVKAILPEDKWNRFQSLITVPLPTNKQCQSIFTELRKVFESQDGAKKLQFIDPSLLEDFAEFDKTADISSFMKTKGWEAIKLNVSSFLVIDLPQQQITPRPAPYPVIIPVANVFTCNFTENEQVDYLFYFVTVKEGLRMIVLDDEYYRIYDNNDSTNNKWVCTLQNAHSTFNPVTGVVVDGPGYTPATGVWKTASKSSSFINKIGPVTNVLGDLDWFLFKEISFKYLGLYGDYPIIFTFEQTCDYKNDQGAMCEGGKVERQFPDGLDNFKSVWEDCPACSARKRIGPGSVGTIKAPLESTDINLMDKPIHIAEISNDKLEWGESHLDELENDIWLTCVGADLEPVTMAQNEQQVQRSFESKQNVLERVAKNIDVTEKFLYDTVCYLRYGRKYFLGSVINSGTIFYLQTIEDIDARYGAAKSAGKPMYELADLRDQANKTENRNNPDALARINILSQLEPWPDLSITQMQSLGLQNTDIVNFTIKVNFAAYINRFERENINVVEFGSNTLTLAQKINLISTKLIEYANGTITSARPNPQTDVEPAELSA